MRDSVDKLFDPFEGCIIEIMRHDYCVSHSLSEDTVNKMNIFKLYEHWAIENNKYAAYNYRIDHPKT